MKKLIMLSALVISSTVFAAEMKPLTFNQLILKKDSASAIGVHFITNRSLTTWCTGTGSPMSVGSFEAAQAVDSLADGLYKCEGKFVQVAGERSNGIQIFEIGSCTAVNPVDMKADCPTPAPKN